MNHTFSFYLVGIVLYVGFCFVVVASSCLFLEFGEESDNIRSHGDEHFSTLNSQT
jgi:hypothetical protein